MNIELRKVDFVNFLVVSCRFFMALALRCILLASLLLIIQPLKVANAEMQHITEENVLEVYVRDGCPHCAKAKKFLLEFSHERPWLRIVYRSVDHDSNARNDLLRYAQAAGIWPVGVPTFRFNNQLLAGFDSPTHFRRHDDTAPGMAGIVFTWRKA